MTERSDANQTWLTCRNVLRAAFVVAPHVRFAARRFSGDLSVTIELLSYDRQDLANAWMQARRLTMRHQFSEPGFDSRSIQRDGISQLSAPQGNSCVLDGRDVLRNALEQTPSKFALRIQLGK
jgi:hypothetical protein